MGLCLQQSEKQGKKQKWRNYNIMTEVILLKRAMKLQENKFQSNESLHEMRSLVSLLILIFKLKYN